MKKLMLFIISMLFVLSGCTNNSVEKTKEASILSKDSAFTLVEKREIKKLGAVAYRFRHKKTKAEVIYLDDNNPEKTFGIAFKTPVVDDTGVNHVFEHAVLQGSKKYPDKDLFYELDTKNLPTFMNAMTTADSTIYPFSAVEEGSFNNLMDIYLDAVFNPMVLNDINTLRREGWRYDINPKTNKVIYNGIVYNEMKGVFSNPYASLGRSLNQLIYPDKGANYAFTSGGLPSAIPTLTLDKLRRTHKKYYTPTNSITVLGGKLDINKKLAKLDEYFNKYDETPKATLVTQTTPLVDKFHEKQYPGQKGSPNIYYYTFLEKKHTSVTELAFVVSLLADYEASPLRKVFKENKFSGNFGFYNGSNIQPTAQLSVQGAKKEELGKFRIEMDKAIEKAYEDGFNQNLIDLALRDYKKDEAKAQYSRVRAQDLLYNVSKDYFYNDRPLYSISDEPSKVLDDLASNPEKIKGLIKKYFIDNNNKNEVLFTPNPKLIDDMKKDEDKRASKYENSLSKEDRVALEKEIKDFNTWSASKASQEIRDSIPKITLASLKESKVPTVKRTLHSVENTDVIDNDINTYGVNLASLRFNTSFLTKQERIDSNLLGLLLDATDTKEMSYQDITENFTKYFLAFKNSPRNYLLKNNEPAREYSLYFEYLQDDSKEVFKTINDLVLNSTFSNKDEVKRRLEGFKSNLLSTVSDPGTISGLSRYQAGRMFNKNYSYIIDGQGANPEMLKEVDRILNDFDNEYPKLQKSLIALRKKIFNKDKLLVFYANKGNFENFKSDISPLLKELPNNKYTKIEDATLNKNNLAITVPSQNGASSYANNLELLGYKPNGKFEIMTNIADERLNNIIRVQNGAYGAWFYMTENQDMIATSYRDGEVGKTIDAFRSLPGYFSSLENTMTQQKLDGYILQSMGKFYKAYTPDALFDLSFTNYRFNKDSASYEKEKKEVLSTNLEDLKTFTDVMTKFKAGNYYSTVNNKNLIEEKQNKGDYTKVIDVKEMK